MKSEMRRREFLESLGIGTAGVLTAGYTATALGYAANETINVGCIGTGGRCRALMKSFQQVPGTRIAAVCDIYDTHLSLGKQLADPKAFVTKSFHELLARKDIDAVIIGSPDHWHVPMTIAACQAGKDVYVEKPLTHDLAEGKAVIAAQNEYQRIVQVGTQQRSMTHFIEAKKIVESGKLGEINKVHLTWNRNQPRGKATENVDPKLVDWKQFLGTAKDQPFDPYRFRQWRWFWDFGGGILTDLMVHFIDVANWYLDLDHPETAATIGDNFQTEGIWETPDTIQTLLHYPAKRLQLYFEGTFVNARNAAMLEFMGRDATLYLDRGRYRDPPREGEGRADRADPGQRQARGRLLRRARRRAVAPDELDRVRSLAQGAQLPGRGRGSRGDRSAPGQPRVPDRQGRSLGRIVNKSANVSGGIF